MPKGVCTLLHASCIRDEYAVGPGEICNEHNRPLKAGEATIQRCRAWTEENKMLFVYTWE